MTCTKIKKSSNAHEKPKINEANPNHKAKIAQPWKRFLRFLMFVLLSVLFSSISMYLGIFLVTGIELRSFTAPLLFGSLDNAQKLTGSTVIWLPV